MREDDIIQLLDEFDYDISIVGDLLKQKVIEE